MSTCEHGADLVCPSCEGCYCSECWGGGVCLDCDAKRPFWRDQALAVEFFKRSCQEVGLKRLLELVGWCVLWQLQGEVDLKKLRKKLEENGYARSQSYRAIDQIKRLKVILIELERKDATEKDVVLALRNLSL